LRELELTASSAELPVPRRAERRAVSAVGGGRSLDDVGGEAVVEEAHDHRSVSDRGVAAYVLGDVFVGGRPRSDDNMAAFDT
jgi:hypothetical protein